MSYLDITDNRYGKLIAVEYVGKNKHKKALWKCKCDCGGETITDVTSLNRGHTKSCGCLIKEIAPERNRKYRTTHGKSKTRLYRIWAGMIQRCKSDKHYAEISVCEEWFDFERFYEWAISNGYQNDLEIDRKNNKGNYEPCNCRWATRSQQMRNTSSTHFMTYGGITQCQTEWLDSFGLKSKKSFQMMRKKGFSDEQIIEHYLKKRGIVMESMKVFAKGERVLLEYEIDGKFMNGDEIYYTLKNPANGTYLKGFAFTADELIAVDKEKKNEVSEL